MKRHGNQWSKLRQSSSKHTASYRSHQKHESKRLHDIEVTFFPAITPLYSPVWINKRAECSKNRHPWYEVKCRVQNKNPAMNDITAGYKIRIWQWRYEIWLHCHILILYPALYFISRMPILTTFIPFFHPDRTVQRCDCREKYHWLWFIQNVFNK